MRREWAKLISVGTIVAASLAVLGARSGLQRTALRKTSRVATTLPTTSWSPAPSATNPAYLERFFLVMKTNDMARPLFNCPASAAIPDTLPAGELIELDPQ